jgi:hypothetical protein
MRYPKASSAVLGGLSLLLGGCDHSPSIDILGSFFPAWMLCLVAAIPLTFGARAVLVRFDLENDVGPLSLFYPFSVVLFTSLLWLIFFR